MLSLILDDYDVDYQITVVEVMPLGPHTLVEFYAMRADNQAYMNATEAYFKLTDKGQDYYYPHTDFHFVKINMKGTHWLLVCMHTIGILSPSVPVAMLWAWVM